MDEVNCRKMGFPFRCRVKTATPAGIAHRRRDLANRFSLDHFTQAMTTVPPSGASARTSAVV
jgi:hypothetical protein